MDETQLANLAEGYRALTTEQLRTYRAALEADLAQARRPGSRNTHTVAFAASRIAVIERVLAQRGHTNNGGSR